MATIQAVSIFLNFFEKSNTWVFVVYYLFTLFFAKTTPGGMLSRIETELETKNFIDSYKIILKSLILILFFSIGLNVSISAAVQFDYLLFVVFCAIILINISSAFFTKNRLMIHDILSKTSVKNIEYNGIKTENRLRFILYSLISLCVLLASVKTTIFLKREFEISECENLYQAENYQGFINKCEKYSSEWTVLQLMLGESYEYFNDHGRALQYYIRFYSGKKRSKAPYLNFTIGKIYYEVKDYENAVSWFQKDFYNPMGFYMIGKIYMKKYSSSKNEEDLMHHYVYYNLALIKLKTLQRRKFNPYISILPHEKNVELEKELRQTIFVVKNILRKESVVKAEYLVEEMLKTSSRNNQHLLTE